MPKLEELSKTEASLSPNVSVGMFDEIFNQDLWRLYVSSDHLEAESLAKRFLNVHAQIPGGVSERLTGAVPLETLRFERGGRLHEGFLFLNGAVVKISNGQSYLVLLFIDEETSRVWGYPPNFLSYEDRIKQSRRNEKPGDQQVDPD